MLLGKRFSPGRSALALIALAALSVLAPASASALTYSVNTTADAPDKAIGSGGCETAVAGKCSLRAAIQESNTSGIVDDNIVFDAGVFTGAPASTISLGSVLPAITDTVFINVASGPCGPGPHEYRPCVAIDVQGYGAGLEVKADSVRIEDLAITNATYGIFSNGVQGLIVSGNWIGLKLDGTAGPNNTGILLDPLTDGAQIGGLTEKERNVIGNSNFVGLDIQGADNSWVGGNYFGMNKDGAGPAPNNETDLEVTGTITNDALDNQIGDNVDAGASEGSATYWCDEGCNSFSSKAGTIGAIDLEGDAVELEKPSIETTIQGNYVGLSGNGTPESFQGERGINVGGADKVQIGGDEVGEANHINGSSYGVYAGTSANALVVEGNLLGLAWDGKSKASPSQVGIFDSSEGITVGQNAGLSDNHIVAYNAAIEQHGIGAYVTGNQIGYGVEGQPLGSGQVGIYLKGPTGGNVVQRNAVLGGEATTGLIVENGSNTISGNEIHGTPNAGILVQAFGVLPNFGNEIGGAGVEENEITGSGKAAIELLDEEVVKTFVYANHGAENAGPFIDLGGDGAGVAAGGPNGGIQPPTIDKVTATTASGTSLPNAEIRLYRKATTSLGEIESSLGQVQASAGGQWSATFAQLPPLTSIAATQAGTAQGTSELKIGATPPAEENAGGGNDGGSNNGGGGATTKDTRPPQTTIAKKPKPSGGAKVKFKFSSSEAGSGFECKLDGKPFKKCGSPKTYKGLKPGKHVFKVRAIDAAGNADPSPAKKQFRVNP